MPITAEPTIVGMPYSEFAKKFGEDKAKAALQRIYGTSDPQKAAEMQQQRIQQILNQQSQQKPAQASSGPASPTALVQTQPGQLAPGYSITTGQPVTQPTQLKTPNVVEPLTYKPQVEIKSAPVEKPVSPSQTGSVVYKTVTPASSETSSNVSTTNIQKVSTQPESQILYSSQSQHPYSNLENPYIKVASEKGLTKEQQFRQKVEQAKQEYLQMEQQTPYSKLQEGVSKEIGQMQPGVTRFLKMQAASPVFQFHQLMHGITEPIRQAQIRLKYGEAGEAAIREVQAKEKEAIEQQKEQFQAEYAYYQANPKKAWEDIAKMPLEEKIETALKLGQIAFSAYSLAKGPAPGVKETYRVKVEPSETKVIAETTKGGSMATTKGKIVVEKVTTYGEGKEVVKTIGEYDLKVVSQGVKQGKDVIGTHVIELVDKKTGAVEHYHATGKASEISSAIKTIMQQQAEGKEVTVYQGKQLFVTKQSLYKPETRLVVQPASLERPYPQFGFEYTVEKTQSKALGSYEFLRSLEQPGVEHPYKPYEVVGTEVGRVGVISKQKVSGTTVEFAQKGSVEAALIRGKPIEEPRGFYPPPKEEPIVNPDVAAGIKYIFGEARVGYNYEPFSYVEKTATPELKIVAIKPPTPEPIKTQPAYWGKTVLEDISTKPQTKPVPTAELSVMQQSLIKDIAAMKAPAPTTKANIPIVPITTQTTQPSVTQPSTFIPQVTTKSVPIEKPEEPKIETKTITVTGVSPLEKEKVGVNIESASQAYFSRIGTSYVKETLLNEEEEKARVVTVGPKVTEEQVQTYLTKQIEAEKTVKETTAESSQDVLAIKIKEGIEEKTKKALGMKAEQSINLEEKMVQKLTEKQIQRQMMKQKVIQPTVPVKVFPTAIPTKIVPIVPYIPKLKPLFGGGGGRKQGTRLAIQAWLKNRPIIEPKDVFKALKKVKLL
ncbi:MAG: hypothetical protein LM587_01510 [Candidatus Aenigmarchaeota archaeon]|nr:hypothetical protein [Candidatus Aenigmarchaeota archaeon]